MQSSSLQLSLFDLPAAEPELLPEPTVISPRDYDHIIVAFSGGKDSFACLLHLLELGVDPGKIELWHHLVDGEEHNGLMDWPCTSAYCKAAAAAFGVPLYFSWKVGGFEREMLRDNTPTASTRFQTPDGIKETGGIGPLGRRMLFPQTAASLKTRWCSSYLKVDPCAAAISNQERFLGKRILLLSGERAQESPSRACYKQVEPHRTSGKRRHVTQWRAVHAWTEEMVWEILERHRVCPHPAYRLGFGRCSCACCIFSSRNQWATLYAINPGQVKKVAEYEQLFGKTIHRTKAVMDLVAMGQPYPDMDPADIRAALSDQFEEPIIMPEGAWRLPAGAYGENAGPT